MVDVVIETTGAGAYQAWILPEAIAYAVGSQSTGSDTNPIYFDVEDKGSPTVPVGFFAEYSVENRKVYLRTPGRMSVALLDLKKIITNPATSERVGAVLAEVLSMGASHNEVSKALQQAVTGAQKVIHPLLATCLRIMGKFTGVAPTALSANLYDIFFNRSVNGCGNRAWMTTFIRLIAEDKREAGARTPTVEPDEGHMYAISFSKLIEKVDILVTKSVIRLKEVLLPANQSWVMDEMKEAAVNAAVATQAFTSPNREDMDEGEVVATNLITLSELSKDDVLASYHDWVSMEGDPTKNPEVKKIADAYYKEYEQGKRGESFAVLTKNLADGTSKVLKKMSSKVFGDMVSRITSTETEEVSKMDNIAPINKILAKMVRTVRSIKI